MANATLLSNNYTQQHGRMFTYLWWETSFPNECKFGERFVEPGQYPLTEINKRIRSSLGVRKDQFDDGKIILEYYWDVTDCATKIGRCYKHGAVDNYIRNLIGHKKDNSREVHTLPWSTFKVKVNNLLAKMNQPLPIAGVAAWQMYAANDTINAIASGKKTFMAELCARFGKTIWGGTLICELNSPLTIVASYVLTSLASFEDELSSFEQFKDIVLVDTADDEYQDKIDAALAHKKQVVAFLSLCPGGKRTSKIRYLFDLLYDRLVIIDEADFGAHCIKQANALINVRAENDIVVLMTGTNADKAASYWSVDHCISVVYPELLMEKYNPQLTYPKMLQHFDVDIHRHQLAVDVEFYQMDLNNLVEFARISDPGLFIDDGKFLPSWSKFVANPVKAKGFWTRMLQATFEGQHGFDELSIDYQKQSARKYNKIPSPVLEQRVAMMFLSESMANANLKDAATLAQQALPGYRVVPVYGEDMSNRTATVDVKEEIEKAQGKNVLLLSVKMAQRSFSVGAITELYLAYDKGDNGTTIQKISRALTPDLEGKIGRIVSLSFDRNRDDKFDGMLIETAINYKKNKSILSTHDALKDVLRTVDIFRCTENGVIKLDTDQYLTAAIERNSINRVLGKVCDLSVLSYYELEALALGHTDVTVTSKQDVTQHGKTKDKSKNTHRDTTDKPDFSRERLLAKAREMVVIIADNIDIILFGTNCTNVYDALRIIDFNNDMQLAISEEFGVDYDVVKMVFDSDVINVNILELEYNHHASQAQI
jgi:hypothetical protein